jgi:NTP pyrophosphatase (non-canonical NTP hydrolase)
MAVSFANQNCVIILQDMNLKNLQEKISILNEKTKPHYKLYSQEEKEILTKTVKLNEEVGELCNDILGILKLQRKAKMKNFDKRNIYQEFADVIITTIQLAQVAGVDIERAIEDKLKKIEERNREEKNLK